MAKTGTILSWSSGKDSAWSLQALLEAGDVEVRALITTFNETADRVAMHAVRRELVRAQAREIGIPLVEVALPWPCSNKDYESVFGAELTSAAASFSAKYIAFGDLFLADIRAYREHQMALLGLEPLFPLWNQPTAALAHKIIKQGVRARLTCVDPKQLDPIFVGREYDETLIDELPEDVDPCGENGEFHTFVWDGPMFKNPVHVIPGEIVDRDGFWFADLKPAPNA